MDIQEIKRLAKLLRDLNLGRLEVEEGGTRVVLVGTVYLASESGGKPYVRVGDRVKKGDVLCLLESMKMFNEFRAEVSGAVAEICVENAQIVDFGQNLFFLRVEDGTDAS